MPDSDESDPVCEYTVAWIDALRGRGIFFRGEHEEGEAPAPGSAWSVPFGFRVVNDLTIQAFNEAYYAAQKRGRGAKTVHYEKFFFPLDRVTTSMTPLERRPCSSSTSDPIWPAHWPRMHCQTLSASGLILMFTR